MLVSSLDEVKHAALYSKHAGRTNAVIDGFLEANEAKDQGEGTLSLASRTRHGAEPDELERCRAHAAIPLRGPLRQIGFQVFQPARSHDGVVHGERACACTITELQRARNLLGQSQQGSDIVDEEVLYAAARDQAVPEGKRRKRVL